MHGVRDCPGAPPCLCPNRCIRERIAQVAHAESDDGAPGEAIDALEGSVARHVREEEAELFPQVDGVALDWTEVGIAIAGRREQLRGGPAPWPAR